MNMVGIILIDAIAIFLLGLLDYLKGEARGEIGVGTYLLATVSYFLLPIPRILLYILIGFNVILLLVFWLLYRVMGGVGLLDFVIAGYAPIVFLQLSLITVTVGLILSIIGFFIHSMRSKGLVCKKGFTLAGTEVGVKGWLAWDKWYFMPRNIKDVENDEEILREKEKWRTRKKCEKAVFVMPLVWIYGLFHLGVTITYIAFILTNIPII